MYLEFLHAYGCEKGQCACRFLCCPFPSLPKHMCEVVLVVSIGGGGVRRDGELMKYGKWNA